MQDNTPMHLSPADENLVARHVEIVSGAAIRLVYTDDEAGAKMRAFCGRLEKLLPNLSVQKEAADDEPPGIHVSGNIRFLMVPRGEYLEAFLLSLLGSDTLAAQDMGVDASGIDRRISLPAMMKMYVTENCPFCRLTVPKGLFLAGAAPLKIDFTLIDALLFPGMAQTDGVRAAPATIVDDTFRWSGDFSLAEVIETIAARNPAELGRETLKKMISEGGAERVAGLMDAFDTVIPAFTESLTAEKWPERLGAMVAFEYLAEKNPALAQTVVDMLWERFDSLDTAIMGDVLHLVGVLNRAGEMQRVEAVAGGAYPEPVKTVAREVFEALGEGQGRV